MTQINSLTHLGYTKQHTNSQHINQQIYPPHNNRRIHPGYTEQCTRRSQYFNNTTYPDTYITHNNTQAHQTHANQYNYPASTNINSRHRYSPHQYTNASQNTYPTHYKFSKRNFLPNQTNYTHTRQNHPHSNFHQNPHFDRFTNTNYNQAQYTHYNQPHNKFYNNTQQNTDFNIRGPRLSQNNIATDDRNFQPHSNFMNYFITQTETDQNIARDSTQSDTNYTSHDTNYSSHDTNYTSHDTNYTSHDTITQSQPHSHFNYLDYFIAQTGIEQNIDSQHQYNIQQPPAKSNQEHHNTKINFIDSKPRKYNKRQNYNYNQGNDTGSSQH